MRRDLMALLLVVCTIGVAVTLLRRYQAPAPVQVSFAFGMTGSGSAALAPGTPASENQASDRMPHQPQPMPVRDSGYTIFLRPGDPEVRYEATLDGRSTSGTMTPAAYQQFLEGFFKAGGQGRETIAPAAQSGLPWLLELADDGPTPAPQPRHMAPNEAASAVPDTAIGTSRPRAEVRRWPGPDLAPHPQMIRPGLLKPADTLFSTPRPNPDAVQATYWYELQGNGHDQRYILTPFSLDGRQVLAYLQTTVVFSTWNQLQAGRPTRSSAIDLPDDVNPR